MAEVFRSRASWAVDAQEPPRPRRHVLVRHARRHLHRLAVPLVVATDAALIAGCFLFFYAARFHWGWVSPAPAPALGPYLHASVLVAVTWTACLVMVGLYHEKRGASKFDDFVLTAWGLTLGALVTLSLSFFYRSFSYSRLVYAYAFVGSLGALGAWHLALRFLHEWLMTRGWGSLNTLVLGSNSLAASVAKRLVDRPRLGYQVAGLVRLPGDPAEEAYPVTGPLSAKQPALLGDDGDLPGLLRGRDVDAVIIAWPSGSPAQVFGLIQAVTAMRPITVQVVPGMVEMMTAHLEVTSLDGLPTLGIREVALRKWHNRVIKRAMDMVLAACGLTVGAPVLGAIALGVKLTSPGPVFYAQERLGRDGRPFRILKFRSMPVDSETAGPVWARVGDQRATPLGAFLRRYSLDELPQLWNVLKGDMSLVGPRPERPFFVDQFRNHVPKYMDRHLVRCGLTGWAQVNGLRGDVSIEARTRYDIYYVENWSVRLDLRIMLRTVAEIFKRPGY